MGSDARMLAREQREPDLSGPLVVYDGDCPFCSSYVALIRLRESLGRVTLLNARSGGRIVDMIKDRGLDLDKGMVLVLDGEFFHGEDCVHRMALLSTSSGTFNKLNAWLFRHKRVSSALYPLLRSGRSLALRLLGRKKFSELHGG